MSMVDWCVDDVAFANCNCDCPCQFESPTHGSCRGRHSGTGVVSAAA